MEGGYIVQWLRRSSSVGWSWLVEAFVDHEWIKGVAQCRNVYVYVCVRMFVNMDALTCV